MEKTCLRKTGKGKRLSQRDVKDNLILYAILAPVLIYIFIFNYLPMGGVVIAFRDYKPGSKIFSFENWVGLKHFKTYIESVYFSRHMKNTLLLNGLNVIIGFFAALAFALLLNEVKAIRYKKALQTVSYLPHFISAVVVASMTLTLLQKEGLINQIAIALGGKDLKFSTDPSVFPWVYVSVNVWMTFGWNSIIYLAAISGIPPEQYEAARLDGANRWKQLWYVTIPAIKPTMFILLIFAVGGVLNANSEFIMLLYNPAIYDTSDVIGTYVYRIGIEKAQFSYTAAIGIFINAVNFGLLYITNTIARKVNGYSLW